MIVRARAAVSCRIPSYSLKELLKSSGVTLAPGASRVKLKARRVAISRGGERYCSIEPWPHRRAFCSRCLQTVALLKKVPSARSGGQEQCFHGPSTGDRI